jgi:hypothetical protein
MAAPSTVPVSRAEALSGGSLLSNAEVEPASSRFRFVLKNMFLNRNADLRPGALATRD